MDLVTWVNADDGGGTSSAVQDQLKTVQQIQATGPCPCRLQNEPIHGIPSQNLAVEGLGTKGLGFTV